MRALPHKGSQEPVKDEEAAHPISPFWRPTLRAIVEAFVNGDYSFARGIDSVAPVSAKLAKHMEACVRGYGETLKELPNETWKTSIAQWMDGFWEVLVDLWTVESGSSDLVLFVRVFETKPRTGTSAAKAYRFEVDSVHVP